MFGEYYHIIQRGHNRDHIFEPETSKVAFLNMLLKLKRKYHFRLIFYALMDNHYHFVVQMRDVPINRIIQRLNWRYCMYFNKKFSRTGTAYDGRYTAYHVQDERQFMSLIHYVAYNPVTANMVTRPSEYRWCAHRDVLNGDDTIVDISLLMHHFHPDPDFALAAYHAFMEGLPDEVMRRDDAKDLKRLRRRKALQQFARLNHYDSEFYDTNYSGWSREERLSRQRQFVVDGRMNGFTNREIAQYLGTSQSVISRIWRSVRRKDPSIVHARDDP